MEAIVGARARSAIFWSGCAAVATGVGLHLPMFVASAPMGYRMAGMAVGDGMMLGMLLIVLGCAAAAYGLLPDRTSRISAQGSGATYEAPDDTRLGPAHYVMLLVLGIGLVIDTMKPATLGFVLPGIAREYGITRGTAAWLPFVALLGTVVGSVLWGTLADIYGRKASIMLSTIIFIATSVCGTMPTFQWNLVMCFLMGASAGGMMPVVYTLLAEIIPPRTRSWLLVLVGGTGLVGGYLVASLSAALLEPHFGWRSLWLQGFPTGVLLLFLARHIPESPKFLAIQGRVGDLDALRRRFGIVERTVQRPRGIAAVPATGLGGISFALVTVAFAWSFVNFGLLLWLPANLQGRGFSAAVVNGLIARSAMIALPTIAVTAFLYSRWSSKWTLVAMILTTLAGLLGTLLLRSGSGQAALVLILSLLIIGSNGVIAVLLPYGAENYPTRIRGRATGLIAGSSKLGGVAVQALALIGLVPTFGGTAILLTGPMALAALMIALSGRETRGRSLRDLEPEPA